MSLGETLRRLRIELPSGTVLGRTAGGAGEPAAVAVPLAALSAAPVAVAGERDDPESALANLLTALAALGLITDGTTETVVP